MMERWGAFVARRALAVLLAGLAVAVAAGAYGFGVFDHLSQGGFDDAGSESSKELVAERDTFGNQNIDVVAVYSEKISYTGVEKVQRVHRIRLYREQVKQPWQRMLSTPGERTVLASKTYPEAELRKMAGPTK